MYVCVCVYVYVCVFVCVCVGFGHTAKVSPCYKSNFMIRAIRVAATPSTVLTLNALTVCWFLIVDSRELARDVSLSGWPACLPKFAFYDAKSE